MTPKRIQRRRSKGWRMPNGAVYVGRPTKWGNPFRADVKLMTGAFRSRADAVTCFATALRGEIDPLLGCRIALPITLDMVRRELRGKDLACWCAPGDKCHADVLLEVANR